jgi:hypothetical protein
MIFSHSLTSRPIIVGEMSAAFGETSAAPAFPKNSFGDETIAEPSSAAPSLPINGIVDEMIAEPLAAPSLPITGIVDEIIAEPSAVPAFQSKGLSEAKNSFSDGTITFFSFAKAGFVWIVKVGGFLCAVILEG